MQANQIDCIPLLPQLSNSRALSLHARPGSVTSVPSRGTRPRTNRVQWIPSALWRTAWPRQNPGIKAPKSKLMREARFGHLSPNSKNMELEHFEKSFWWISAPKLGSLSLSILKASPARAPQLGCTPAILFGALPSTRRPWDQNATVIPWDRESERKAAY